MVNEMYRHARSQRTESISTFVLVAYVAVWALEGALRKWVPATDSLMYFVRDAAFLLTLCGFVAFVPARRRTVLWPISWTFLLALVMSAAVSVVSERQTLQTAILGLRAYAVPLLVVAYAARYVPGSAIRPISVCIAWLSLLNAGVAVAQVLSPPGAAINLQVGGEEAYFINAGVVRASGTFSSPIGLTLFVSLAAAIMFAALVDKSRPRLLYLGGTVATLVIALIGGSRGAVVGVVVVVAALAFVLLARGSFRAVRLLAGIIVLLVVIYAFAAIALPQVLESFATRVEDASRGEDAGGRVWDSVFGFFSESFPLAGDGPGSHTVAATQLTGAAWIEVESIRWVHELGLLGYLLAIARLVLCAGLILVVLTSANRRPMLASLAVAAYVPVLAAGSMTQQPTTQGFAAVGAAVLLLCFSPSPSLSGDKIIVGRRAGRSARHPEHGSVQAIPQRRIASTDRANSWTHAHNLERATPTCDGGVAMNVLTDVAIPLRTQERVRNRPVGDW